MQAREYLSNRDNWCPEDVGEKGLLGNKRCALQALGWTFGDGGRVGLSTLPYFNFFNQVAIEMHGEAAVPLNVSDVAAFAPVMSVNRMGYEKVMELYDRTIAASITEDHTVEV